MIYVSNVGRTGKGSERGGASAGGGADGDQDVLMVPQMNFHQQTVDFLGSQTTMTRRRRNQQDVGTDGHQSDGRTEGSPGVPPVRTAADLLADPEREDVQLLDQDEQGMGTVPAPVWPSSIWEARVQESQAKKERAGMLPEEPVPPKRRR